MNQTRAITYLPSAVLVALSTLITSGCGFIFSHAPPPGHETMASFTCTESDAGPIIDLIWAGLNVAGALAAAGDPNAYYNSNQIVAVGLSWGVVSGSAAVVGFNKSKKCRSAKEQLAIRQSRGWSGQPARADGMLQTVVIAPATDTLQVGGRAQMVATAHSSSGGILSDRLFTWSSSNDAIASVSSAGLVTANASGAVIVAANTGGVVGTASIVVVPRR